MKVCLKDNNILKRRHVLLRLWSELSTVTHVSTAPFRNHPTTWSQVWFFFFLSFLVVCYIVLCFTGSYSRSCRRCFSFSGMYWRELETDFQTRSENRRTRRIQGKATVLCKQACEEDQEMLSDVAKQLAALLFHSCFRNFFFFSQTP